MNGFFGLSGAVASVIALAAGCSVPADLLVDRSCPCASGWFCDDARDICVRGGVGPSVDAGAPPVVGTTCWLRSEACDWTDPTSFELVQDDDSVLAGIRVGANPTWSPDACTLLYSRSGDLQFAVRPGPGEAFADETTLDEVNTADPEGKATVSPDGLELLFQRTVGGIADIYRSRRETTVEPWGTAMSADDLNAPGLATVDLTLAPHGLRVYFARRSMAAAEKDLQFAERSSLAMTFETPARIDELSLTISSDTEPSVTADDRVIAFVTQRDGDTATELYFATRENWSAPWGSATRPPGPVLDASPEEAGAISPDGCELLVLRLGAWQRLLYREAP